MADYAGCSEDDLINITFEFCNTKETGAVPASVFIKYLEEMTGHSHENSKLLLLYNMLDPERHNVLVDRETFHAAMKTWIAKCYQDCISESEADKSKTPTNGALQYSDMLSFLSDENTEIFEGRPEEAERAFDLNSSVEDLKYMNRKMTQQLLGIQKVMEMSEENCLKLTDEVVELRGRLTSMQKPVGNIKYISNELEDTKRKMANLHEENHVICGSVTNLKKQVESLTTKLISLEENSAAYQARETSLCEAVLLLHSQEHFQNILKEIKSQKNSIFEALMKEIELKQKMGHSLVTAVQILANVCSFMEMWDKVLKRLETFLDSQLLAKSTCLNNTEFQKTEELSDTNEHLEQCLLRAEIHDTSIVNSNQCLFGRAKISVPKDHIGVSLNRTALQTVDAASFSNQMLLHNDQLSISVLIQTWKNLLHAEKKWGNLEGRLESILEIARSLAKDNSMPDEKKKSNKPISGHKIQLDQKKGKPCTTSKLKESALHIILRQFYENVPESNLTNLQFIKALQLWISESEGYFLTQEYSKEEKYNFHVEKKIPNSTQVVYQSHKYLL
ncbi:hypothetical protein lerEdw1_005357 [Lerista edwardsae]|nr:hypothetical protein lerEdw1_005357 [Lerista edwardsae]